MSFERNQELRTLQSQYLKLKWKISKYKEYIDLAAMDKSQLMVDRLKGKLDVFIKEHDQIWEKIKTFY